MPRPGRPKHARPVLIEIGTCRIRLKKKLMTGSPRFQNSIRTRITEAVIVVPSTISKLRRRHDSASMTQLRDILLSVPGAVCPGLTRAVLLLGRAG